MNCCSAPAAGSVRLPGLACPFLLRNVGYAPKSASFDNLKVRLKSAMGFVDSLKRQFVLANVSGIPVRADMRWIFVLALMAVIIAASVAPISGSTASAAVFGIATTLIFFLSIFLHEFAHAGIARIEGLRVVEIVLHPFGGLTRFASEPETPRAEFRIAIAGPAASFILAVLFAGLASAATAIGADTLVVIAATLAIGNFLLAVFNLFPGYPLDGGRVLRAYLWRSGKDLSEATILTGRCGQVIAVAMVVFGFITAVFRGDFFTGFWVLLVGVFLWDSAKGIIRDIRRQEKTPVESVMYLPVTASPDMSIQTFVDTVLSMHRQGAFPVTRNRNLLGVLLLEDMKKVERKNWQTNTLIDVMRPVEALHFVEVGTSLSEAREVARTNGVGSVYVIARDGLLVGVVRSGSSPQT